MHIVTLFLLKNDAYETDIKDLVNRGYLVRTRIDGYPFFQMNRSWRESAAAR